MPEDDHFFDTFTSRTCHGHPLPCNGTTGECVSDADADRVHALGDFEYKCVHISLENLESADDAPFSYIWNTAENATDYVKLTFGTYLSLLQYDQLPMIKFR